MKLFAKTKYNVLSGIFFVKAWCKNLTKVSIMEFVIGIFVIGFLGAMFYSQTVKWEVYKQERKIEFLNEGIVELNYGVNQRDSLILDYKSRQKLTNLFVREMFSSNYYINSLTGYHPTVEQCDRTPDITADGTKFDINKAGEYNYVALSRDLLAHFNKRGADIQFSDYVLIKGTPNGAQDGIYQVRDTMNKRHTEWIDILLTPGEKSFYYRNILMHKITDERYVSILQEIYGSYPEQQPIAMVEPEVQ